MLKTFSRTLCCKNKSGRRERNPGFIWKKATKILRSDVRNKMKEAYKAIIAIVKVPHALRINYQWLCVVRTFSHDALFLCR